jgi:uncharacterized protein with PhoU and TrkA domain
MTRRGALCILPLSIAAARGVDRAEILQAVAPLAAALSEDSSDAFMDAVDVGAPDREKLRGLVRALLAATEVTSSVEVSQITQDGGALDWLLQMSDKNTQTVVERRRGTVRVKIRDKRVAVIEPVEFFKPPDASRF